MKTTKVYEERKTTRRKVYDDNLVNYKLYCHVVSLVLGTVNTAEDFGTNNDFMFIHLLTYAFENVHNRNGVKFAYKCFPASTNVCSTFGHVSILSRHFSPPDWLSVGK